MHATVPTERVQYIHVRAGETGHSYSTVFSTCMDGNVESIAVSAPYIRARHQLHNFVRFCELAVKKCLKLKGISLTTGRELQSEVGMGITTKGSTHFSYSCSQTLFSCGCVGRRGRRTPSIFHRALVCHT